MTTSNVPGKHMEIRSPQPNPASESARLIVALHPSVVAAYNVLLEATGERISGGGNREAAIADMKKELAALNRQALG